MTSLFKTSMVLRLMILQMSEVVNIVKATTEIKLTKLRKIKLYYNNFTVNQDIIINIMKQIIMILWYSASSLIRPCWACFF